METGQKERISAVVPKSFCLFDKEGTMPAALSYFSVRRGLCRVDSFGRANVRASTTVGAHIRVDMVDIAFRDSFYRAFADASAASYTVF